MRRRSGEILPARVQWEELDEGFDLPPYDGGPPRTCLIAATPRSGSYFLSHLLRASGRLGVPFEYLNPAFLTALQVRFGAAGPEATLREIVRRRTGANGWFALKAHWGQFGPARKRLRIEERIAIGPVIFLGRRDRLAQAVSLVIAEQTNSWTSAHPIGVRPVYSIAAIADALRRIEADYRGWRAWFAATGVEPIYLVYEELAEAPLAALNLILERCALDPLDRVPTVAISRQATAVNQEWKDRYATASPLLRWLHSRLAGLRALRRRLSA